MVIADITAADLDPLMANNPSYVVPEADKEDPLRAASILMYSMLFHGVDTGAGETALRDRDGRNWTIPATSIVAFSYSAPDDGRAREDLAFVKPKQARGAYSSD